MKLREFNKFEVIVMSKNEMRVKALERAAASKPTKESATESFKKCGIMNKSGEIKKEYKEIFVKTN
jgi:hypothetical protein|nr:MAG TPA: hypothetical protein [Caudoviricetes sp.]